MATQLHIAESSRVQGIAVLAAGPYDCAQGTIARALGPCLKGADLSAQESLELAKTRSAAGEVDDLDHIADDPVWIFHGTNDDVVASSVTQALYDLYAHLVDKQQIRFEDKWPAAHGMPTLDAGAVCQERRSPFVNACNYDAAGNLLNHLHGLSNAPANPDLKLLEAFDQSCCASSDALLADAGYVFVPRECQAGDCDVHMVLHGCQQGEEFVQMRFIEQAGYLSWAQSNQLIVLFPQVARSLLNPAGCWDWWGYTGANYATRTAPQIQALMAMFEHFSDQAGAQ